MSLNPLIPTTINFLNTKFPKRSCVEFVYSDPGPVTDEVRTLRGSYGKECVFSKFSRETVGCQSYQGTPPSRCCATANPNMHSRSHDLRGPECTTRESTSTLKAETAADAKNTTEHRKNTLGVVVESVLLHLRHLLTFLHLCIESLLLSLLQPQLPLLWFVFCMISGSDGRAIATVYKAKLNWSRRRKDGLGTRPPAVWAAEVV